MTGLLSEIFRGPCHILMVLGYSGPLLSFIPVTCIHCSIILGLHPVQGKKIVLLGGGGGWGGGRGGLDL